MAEILVSVVEWLLQVHPKIAKPPRAKKSCDYCGTDKLGLGIRGNMRNAFCGVNCEASFINCVYRPPDELVTLLRYPPDSVWLETGNASTRSPVAPPATAN
jgi:hypothetical protein